MTMPTHPTVTSTNQVDDQPVAALFGPPMVLRHHDVHGTQQLLGAGKPLVLLARLILEQKPLTREATMAFLWPETPEIRARASLRQALHLLRQAVGPGVLETTRQVITLDRTFKSDVDGFLRSVSEADDDAATRQYRGVFLQDLSIIDSSDAEQWIEFERHRLARLFHDAALRQTSFLIGSGRVQEAVVLSRRLRDADPTVARYWRPLMTALKASGNPREFASERASLQARVNAELVDDPELARTIIGKDDAAGSTITATGGVDHTEPPTSATWRRPFVGRVSELDHLASVLNRSIAGHPDRCLVIAPSGTGKSRLLREFATQPAVTGNTVFMVGAERWCRDEPMSYVSNLIEILVQHPAAINITRQSASVLTAITPTVRYQLVVTAAGASECHPVAVAAALGNLLTELAGERPVVLMLDDLHAADTVSLAALDALVDNLQGVPVLILGAAQRQVDPSLMNWPVCAVPRLLQEQTAALLAQVAGAIVSPDVVEPIHRASDGRPLIAQHLVRSLLESDQLRVARDLTDWAAEPCAALDSRDVLAARIMRRSPEERQMLSVIAAADCALHMSRLVDAMPPSVDTLACVRELTGADLVTVDENDDIRITHDSVAVAILGNLTLPVRQSITRRVAIAMAPHASTLHEMRRVVHLLTAADAPTDIDAALEQWRGRPSSNGVAASAIVTMLRPTTHARAEITPQRASYSALVVYGLLAALIGALVLSLRMFTLR